VEAVAGVLFFFSAWIFREDPLRILASYFWSSFIILLVVSDIKWSILPHPFNNLFVVGGFLYSGLNAWRVTNDSAGFQAVVGFLGVGALMVAVASLFPKGLGGGDVKMIAAFGAWMGLKESFLIVLLAFGAGALWVLPLLAVGKVHRKTLLPFGPFLATAAGFVWFFPREAQLLIHRMS